MYLDSIDPSVANAGEGPGRSAMKLESRTSTLQDLYADESARIRNHFEDSGDGKAAIRDRSSLDRFRGQRVVERSCRNGRTHRGILHRGDGRIRPARAVSVFGYRSSVLV